MNYSLEIKVIISTTTKLDILLVDDRQENLLSLEATLACPEYNLIKATSGDEALRYLLDHTPALILMDIQMPELNGLEIASIIKRSERTREIPIIFITAIGKDEQMVHQGYSYGAVDYIYKPFDPVILRAKVGVFAEIRRQHGRISRLVAVQQAVTQALAETPIIEEAVSTTLKSICNLLGWDLGIFWKIDKQTQELFCHTQWYDAGEGMPTNLVASSFKKKLTIGNGIPGRVWKNKVGEWISNVKKEVHFTRLLSAYRDDINVVVAVPVSIQDEVIGVLEFFNRKKIREDFALVKILTAIGSQMGQVIKRSEAFDMLRGNEARMAFLAAASTTLSTSLNFEETFVTVSQLAVKSLADWCAIDVIEDGVPRSITIAHLDQNKLKSANELREKYPPNWNASHGAPNVIRTGKSELYPQIPHEILVEAAQNEEHLKLICELGMKSAMVVPLPARGTIFGAMTFISAESGRQYTEEDLLFAEEFARRAALAMDNARLYRDAQEAIRTRDEFFSIASHELKTPITALKMMVQVTQRSVKPQEGLAPAPEKLSKMLNSSSKQIDRLTHLVEDLLDVVKIRAGKLSFKLEELNLTELLKEVIEEYSEALTAVNCSLEMHMVDEVIGCWDRTRIEQVAINLLSNAIKYAPGKPIRIEVRADENTNKAIFSVKDFGPGIPLEQQPKIFDRFERGRPSRNITGLGLGLFIVKHIVEAHHGSIRIESEKSLGSTFIVELPLLVKQGVLPSNTGLNTLEVS